MLFLQMIFPKRLIVLTFSVSPTVCPYVCDKNSGGISDLYMASIDFERGQFMFMVIFDKKEMTNGPLASLFKILILYEVLNPLGPGNCYMIASCNMSIEY